MYQLTRLDNGLRVVTVPMPHVQSVSIGIFMGVGSRYESEAISGTSHFIEHMVFKGTANWPTARDIAEAIEGKGGVLTPAPAWNRPYIGPRSPQPTCPKPWAS